MSTTTMTFRGALEHAIGWRCFLEQHTSRSAAYQARYDAFALTGRDLEPLLGRRVPVDVLAIVEEWCPDVLATLPLFARIADSTDRLRLHILIRTPQLREIAERYPAWDGRSHVPTYVFAEGQRELGVLIDRAEAVTNILDGWIDNLVAGHRTATRQTWRSDLPADEVADALQTFQERRIAIIGVEKAAVLEAVREIIAAPAPDRRQRLVDDLRVARAAQWCS